MNNRITVSFDFDSTLSRQDVQDFAESLLSRGVDVWVVTSRNDDLHLHKYLRPDANNLDLWAVVDKVGIPREKIIFTNFRDKHEYLKDTPVICHLDDDWIELNFLNKLTKVVGISVVGGNNWKNKVNRLIEQYEK